MTKPMAWRRKREHNNLAMENGYNVWALDEYKMECG